MNQADLSRYIVETLPGVDVLTDQGDSYFYYDPDRSLPHDNRWPFATIMTTDRYDQASNLDRDGVYRLNIGIEKETYRSIFGPPPAQPSDYGPVDTGHDFTSLDTLMPHPIYAPQSWVCVLNPGDKSLERAQELLKEAHAVAMRKYNKV